MSKTIELPDSIKNCLPCQRRAIVSHLIAICKISKELNQELNCLQLAEDIKEGNKSTEDVIQLIAEKSKDKQVEHVVDKIIHVLDEKN